MGTACGSNKIFPDPRCWLVRHGSDSVRCFAVMPANSSGIFFVAAWSPCVHPSLQNLIFEIPSSTRTKSPCICDGDLGLDTRAAMVCRPGTHSERTSCRRQDGRERARKWMVDRHETQKRWLEGLCMYMCRRSVYALQIRSCTKANGWSKSCSWSAIDPTQVQVA